MSTRKLGLSIGLALTFTAGVSGAEVIRRPADFRRLVDTVVAEGACRFVDLGPSGTLASFVKHGYGGRIAQTPAINQFGRNLQSVSELFADLAA